MAAAGRAAGPVRQPQQRLRAGRAIRGGIPIVFPWFGANRQTPTAPQHGFARTATWHLDGVETAEGGSLTLTLSLGDGDVGSPFWPERFRAIYTVSFARTLSLRLAVQNLAPRPIRFEEEARLGQPHRAGSRCIHGSSRPMGTIQSVPASR